jgi:hypothetical protein
MESGARETAGRTPGIQDSGSADARAGLATGRTHGER